MNTKRASFALSVAAAALAMVPGCGEPAPQVVTGTVALATFPDGLTPTTVEAVRRGRAAATAPVAADGGFRLSLRRGHTYRVRFAGSAGDTPLVMPLQDGTVRDTVNVRRAERPFDVGTVRRLGDMRARTFVFLR